MNKTQMALTWLKLLVQVKTPDGVGTVVGMNVAISENIEFGVIVKVYFNASDFRDYDAVDLEPIL
jgi:hypothetical protein